MWFCVMSCSSRQVALSVLEKILFSEIFKRTQVEGRKWEGEESEYNITYANRAISALEALGGS
jgi:hypothetical protein